MTLRQRIFLATGILAGIIIIIGAVLLFNREKDVAPAGGNEQEEGAVSSTPSPTAIPSSLIQQEKLPAPAQSGAATPLPTVAPEEQYARQLATIFVERFASYSNQNNNKHIESVASLVTERMMRWILTQAEEESALYEGVTTDVIAAKVTQIDAAKATVTMEVQQRIEDTAGERTEQKKARVVLVKEEGGWKVDGLFWE